MVVVEQLGQRIGDFVAIAHQIGLQDPLARAFEGRLEDPREWHVGHAPAGDGRIDRRRMASAQAGVATPEAATKRLAQSLSSVTASVSGSDPV